MIVECLTVAIGGAVGSVLRYLLGLIPFNESGVFPVNTLIVNIVGALAIGVITAVVARNSGVNDYLVLFMQVGVCGGFTTFSTFALETGDLISGGSVWLAILYVFLSVFFGVLAVFLPEIVLR